MDGAESNSNAGMHLSDWILVLGGNFNSKPPYQCDDQRMAIFSKCFT